MKLALTVGYLGEGFSGSQFQPDKRTVEGEFIKAGISCKAWTMRNQHPLEQPAELTKAYQQGGS